MSKSLPQDPILEYLQTVFFPGCIRSIVVRSSCQKVSRQSGMTPFPYMPGNLQYWMWWSFTFQWLQTEDTITQSTWLGGSQKTVGFECEVGRTGGLEPLHSGWRQHTAHLVCTRRQKLKRSCCHCLLYMLCLYFCNSCTSREVKALLYNAGMLVLQASISITNSPGCVLQT